MNNPISDDSSASNALSESARHFMRESIGLRYSYNFNWLGRPIIQYPQDIQAAQENILNTQPDLIVETGVAHGGSVIFSASMLALLDLCGDTSVAPGHNAPARKVLGIDIDIRQHNRQAIEAHPLGKYIQLIEGSSTSESVVKEVRRVASQHRRVMVCLDSNHTHEHVLSELTSYAPLVSEGCYCIVFDTIIEHLPEGTFPDRPWKRGDNPMTAIDEFMGLRTDFEIDRDWDNKLAISVAPGGYLRRMR